MHKITVLLGVTGIAVLIGFGLGWTVATSKSATRLERIVAMSWGDGHYGKAFYGAHVYLVPQAGDYSVRARVLIGRGNNYFHDCGELGRAPTDTEAVARWGNVQWLDDGLHIGTGTNHYFLPRARMESHR